MQPLQSGGGGGGGFAMQVPALQEYPVPQETVGQVPPHPLAVPPQEPEQFGTQHCVVNRQSLEVAHQEYPGALQTHCPALQV